MHVVKLDFRRLRLPVDLVTQLVLLFAPRALAARLVDDLAMRGGGDPRGGILRKSALAPGGDGRGEGLLHGLLGAVERSANADQSGDDAPVLRAKHGLRRSTGVHRQTMGLGTSDTGRTSMHPSPPLHFDGIRAAQPSASSRSLQSMM